MKNSRNAIYRTATDTEIKKALLDSVRNELNADDLCEADERLSGGRWGVQLGSFVRLVIDSLYFSFPISQLGKMQRDE
jgi:hypothetical protein